jgi:response regulator RpfG family c-di-GMP phosphodiesterase
MPADDATVQAARTIDQLVKLLAHMIDVQRPGAGERGRQLAEASRQLAERFQVPDAFLSDLDRAAWLHEIGLAVEGSSGDSGWLSPADVRSLIIANHLLSQVDVLRPAAFLVAAIGEHWDGSGFPDRLQRGQIPLRSRLLRVLIDYHVVLEQGVPIDAALEAVALHSGTWYDPAVVAQLTAIAMHTPGGVSDRGKWRVPISRLSPGMVLAEDLCTASGLKLVAAGATITAHMLEVVRQRDTVDPVIDAWISPATV